MWGEYNDPYGAHASAKVNSDAIARLERQAEALKALVGQRTDAYYDLLDFVESKGLLNELQKYLSSSAAV